MVENARGREMDSEAKDRRLCSECVSEAFLRSEIRLRGEEAECFYCGGRYKTFSLSEVADEVERALNEHFYRTATEPSGLEYAMLKEGDGYWERKGDPIDLIIEDTAGIEVEPAEDILRVLRQRNRHFNTDTIGEEEPFDKGAHYAESGVDVAESQAGWFHFEKSLKTQARYFNRTAESTLTSVFEGIADHVTREGRPVIVEAGPGKQLAVLYRARVFQSDEKLEEALSRPDRDVGPPPALAAAAGRMNAHGVSVFYGATNPNVALAEVRPPVGSKVLVARFELLRAARLLDVEALRSVNIIGSVFDRSYLPRLQRAKFLQWLSQRITMPVMPDDEPFEYLATQAVADFLATIANPPLDGIIYPSAQGSKGELNVVLFHKAARVRPLDIPEGTKIDARLYEHNDDGIEIYPWVTERVPAKPAEDAAPIQLEPKAFFVSDALDTPDTRDYDDEGREPVLKLDTSNLQVHIVDGIEFRTESYTVHRHRIEERKSPF